MRLDLGSKSWRDHDDLWCRPSIGSVLFSSVPLLCLASWLAGRTDMGQMYLLFSPDAMPSDHLDFTLHFTDRPDQSQRGRTRTNAVDICHVFRQLLLV